MGTVENHILNARQAKNNAKGVYESKDGNVSGVMTFFSLSIEHVLKAFHAYENDGRTGFQGHNLGTILSHIEHDLGKYEDLIWEVDGMHISSRYDSEFNTDLINDFDLIMQKLISLINYIERVNS